MQYAPCHDNLVSPSFFDLLILGGHVVTSAGCLKADIGIRNGKIAKIGELDPKSGQTIVKAHGLHILPGAIDTQVHFREPGLEHKEDIESGTRSAISGGVTCVFEMPNTQPPTITPETLSDKLNRATHRAWCDYAFFIGATPSNAALLKTAETSPGCAGVKIFMGSSTGTLLVDEEESLKAVLKNGYRRVSVHCEDQSRLQERYALVTGKDADPSLHPVWRDVETAFLATRRLISIARQYGRRVHILHITTREEIAFLAEQRDIATLEVTPQHLTLSAPDCYRELGSLAQMNPPIRDETHQQALWQAVREGLIDVIGSDHAPHTREEKSRPYPDSPSGMTGVQTLLPIMLDHVAAGRLTLARMVELTASGPARIFGIARKGRIARGYDADLVLVDLKKEWLLTDDWIASRSGWTPYAGRKITGNIITTILRGQIVLRDHALQGTPIGQPVHFLETLTPSPDTPPS